MRNLEIERLRGIAVLFVLTVHCGFIYGRLPESLQHTFTGVDLFFVISGFVVASSLLKSWDRELSFTHGESRNRFLAQFYLRRGFRLLPTAYIWMLVHLLLTLLIAWINSASAAPFFSTEYLQSPRAVLGDIIRFSTFAFNYVGILVPGVTVAPFQHFWSLAIEWHFYFVLPILIVLLRRSRFERKILLAFLICSTLLFNVILNSVYTSSPGRVYQLGLGVLIAYLPRLNLNFHRKKLMNFAALLLIVLLAWSPGLIGGSKMNFGRSYLIYGLLSFALVLLAREEKGYVLKIPLIAPFLEFTGKISYALYVCHITVYNVRQVLIARWAGYIPQIFWLGQETVITMILQIILNLIPIFAIAALLHYWIEIPAIRFGKQLGSVLGYGTKEAAFTDRHHADIPQRF